MLMGLFDKLRAGRDIAVPLRQGGAQVGPRWPATFQVNGGSDDLEVVGEASYQDALWRICRGRLGDRVRHDCVAVLVPEPTNPYDEHAVAVMIEGSLIGYLRREIAADYLPGLLNLMGRTGGHIALRGVVVGGGYRDHGPGMLGVWLEHDPRHFGIDVPGRPTGPRGRPEAAGASMRTGFTEAWVTDAEDDSYDLSWYSRLPEDDLPAIAELRRLLDIDPDPIDRHFQFAELEARLYRCRERYPEALDGFDETCHGHDAEMEAICQAFMAKWGRIPVLETYRQMAIRQQKKRDWRACAWWAERGLSLYGSHAAREEAVEDLVKRRNRAAAKLDPPR
ncbi:HIRAN domain-containing protein [Flindersiella endophytica]